jgi:hypothetical protein
MCFPARPFCLEVARFSWLLLAQGSVQTQDPCFEVEAEPQALVVMLVLQMPFFHQQLVQVLGRPACFHQPEQAGLMLV